MGRNTTIKHYDVTPAGQPLELLEDSHAKAPVVVELLRSPWIVRASEVLSRDGASVTKRVAEVVTVDWDAERQYPVAFTRGTLVYRVDGVVQIWAADRSWWDPRRRVSRRYWRVLARGGVYDLAYDRETGSWMLIGIQD